MSQLPIPIKDVLVDEPDQVALERVWRRIEDDPRRRRSPGRWLLPSFAACAAAAALAFFALRAPRPAPSPGPLHVVEASRAVDLSLALARPSGPLALSDGSQLSLEPGTRLELLDNSASAVSLLLSRGAATFDVKPGGPRRWTIEAGLATLEVVGTRFVVRRDGGRLRVQVERGVVLVRGELVPGRAQRLTEGGQLELSEPAPLPAPAPATLVDRPAAAPVAERLPAPVAPERAPASPAPAPQDERWQSLASQGDFSAAFESLGAAGVRRELERFADSPEHLLALADVARISGHPADAVAPLRRILGVHRDDRSAPLAAFTLGKLELDALAHPAEAADAFATAIALRAPQGLLEACYARLIEARVRAGDSDGARAARAEYDALFPAGQYRQEVDSCLPRDPRN